MQPINVRGQAQDAVVIDTDQIAGHHDDWQRRLRLSDRFDHVTLFDRLQAKVDQRRREIIVGEDVERRSSVGAQDDRVPLSVQQELDDAAHRRLVVDDKNCGHGHPGFSQTEARTLSRYRPEATQKICRARKNEAVTDVADSFNREFYGGCDQIAA
jgi:hypothetical protein